MDADEYQRQVARTAGEVLSTEDGLLLSALGICGESGEVADLVKKHLFHSHPLSVLKLREEAGDVAWYLARLCLAMDWSLGEVLAENIVKLRRRYPEGFNAEQSMNRGKDDA